MKSKILLYNASVSIVTTDELLIRKIRQFIAMFYTRPVDDTRNYEYVGHCASRNEYTFLNEQFRHFYHWTSQTGYKIPDCVIVDNKEYKLPKERLKMNKSRKLRDYQEDVAAFCLEDGTNLKFLPLTMGRGKTILAMYCASQRPGKLMLLVEPKFSGKWRDDILVEHDCVKSDIAIIAGKDYDPDAMSLVQFMKKIKDKTIDFKYIVMSLDMFSGFVKTYEENPEVCMEKYGMYPIDFMSELGIGMLAIDEADLSFYSVYSCLLYCNVKFELGMTATLISTDPVDKRAMETAFPLRVRYHTAMRKKYIRFIYVAYTIERDALRSIRYTSKIPGGRGYDVYNHIVFEQSLMKNKYMLNTYLNVVKEVIDHFFFGEGCHKNGKLLIFVASINMATIITKELTRCLTGLKVARYVQADKYSEMLKANVVVSTNQSAGVGITIPDLLRGIQTVTVKSEKRNLQSSGRLREIPGMDVAYISLYSEQIRKQVENVAYLEGIFKDFATDVEKVRSNQVVCKDKHKQPYTFKYL